MEYSCIGICGEYNYIGVLESTVVEGSVENTVI